MGPFLLVQTFWLCANPFPWNIANRERVPEIKEFSGNRTREGTLTLGTVALYRTQVWLMMIDWLCTPSDHVREGAAVVLNKDIERW